MKRALLFCVAFSTSACGVARQMVAPNDDLAAYRAFRVAAHPGTRLQRAQQYLDAHPRGTWAEEVRRAFEADEAQFFEQSKLSRDGAQSYIVDLPRGPHAEAAMALLVEFDTRTDDVETARLLRSARRTEAQLEAASQKRRAVGETVLAAMGALLDEHVYGARIAEAPVLLRRLLGGDAAATWGTTPVEHQTDLYFALPTRDGREDRVATISVRVVAPKGVVIEGRIEGQDLFVRWDEADRMRPLDGSSPKERSAAGLHARELLLGALESRLPQARCDASAREHELLRRECDGWTAVVVQGTGEAPDVISIRGPLAR